MGSHSVLGFLQYFLDPTHTKWGARLVRSRAWQEELNVNLKGKVAVVTGANSGIGRATAQALAARDAEVHMLCRSRERGTAAHQGIVESTGNKDVMLHVVDVSEPPQVASFVKDFSATHSKLDVLVNNAAVMPEQQKVTHAGQEAAFATNLAGFWNLTERLAPLLRSGGEGGQGGRVVNVVSAGMFLARLDPDFIEKGLHPTEETAKAYSGLDCYVQHHRSRVMLTEWFAQHLNEGSEGTPGKGVRVNCVHPGWVDTPGLAQSPTMSKFYSLMRNRLRTEDEGADTVVWLAVAERAREHNGEFFWDRKVKRKHKMLAGTKSPPGDMDRLVEICRRAAA